MTYGKGDKKRKKYNAQFETHIHARKSERAQRIDLLRETCVERSI